MTHTVNDLKMIPKHQLPQDVTLATIEAMAQRVKNWGKWGPDDQIGTLNYVTPDDVASADSLVKRG